MQYVTGDADDPLDQGLPFGVGHHLVRAENICGPGLMAIARSGDRGGAAGGKERCAGGFGILQQAGLIDLQLDNGMRLGVRGGLEGSFSAVQRIEGDGAVRELEFAEYLLRVRNIVGLLVDIDVRQDQAGFGVERMQQLGCFAVGEIVEASPEHLAIKRDGALRSADRTIQETGGMAAEGLLNRLGIKPLEDLANAGMGRHTLPARTEGSVQSAAVYRDEGFDGTIGIATGHHGKDREQQNVG
jgi:hypothetical protein